MCGFYKECGSGAVEVISASGLKDPFICSVGKMTADFLSTSAVHLALKPLNRTPRRMLINIFHHLFHPN